MSPIYALVLTSGYYLTWPTEEKKKDKNLWVIRAVERDVFDTRLELELRDGSANSKSRVIMIDLT